MAENTPVHLVTGTLFNTEQTKELFSMVKGHSALAKLSGTIPVPFSGTDIFTFSMDDEVAIVAEAGNKPAGSATVGSISIKPVKIVYQSRVSDEFMKVTQEKKLALLDQFIDGFQKKIASGLDIMAMHGIDPKSKTESTIIGDNNLDDKITKTVAGTTNPADDLQDAIDLIVEDDKDVNGLILSKKFASSMGKLKDASGSNAPLYDEFSFGAEPDTFAGHGVDVNKNVAYNASKTAGATNVEAYVGDFANCFKWGYADQIDTEVIEYGDPDGQGDLKRMNQIVIRAEAYVGWGILDPASFAKITSKVAAS